MLKVSNKNNNNKTEKEKTEKGKRKKEKCANGFLFNKKFFVFSEKFSSEITSLRASFRREKQVIPVEYSILFAVLFQFS